MIIKLNYEQVVGDLDAGVVVHVYSEVVLYHVGETLSVESVELYEVGVHPLLVEGVDRLDLCLTVEYKR